MYEDLNPKPDRSQAPLIPKLGADQKASLIAERLDQLYLELKKALSPHVSKGRAVYFTQHDLALSIINGATEELYTAFPAPLPKITQLDAQLRSRVDPDGSKSDCDICCLKTNPVIFTHVVRAAQIDGKLPKNISIDDLKQAIFTLEPKVTDEYFEMLQEASRFWSRSLEITNSIGAEFLALIYALESTNASPSFGLHKPNSFFSEESGQGPFIQHSSITIGQRLLPESNVFIGGAGLAILSNLRELQSLSKYHFELNDCDPFVSSCLDHFFRLCPQENISFSAGKMSEVLKKRANLDLIVLSDVYRLRGDSPLELASLFTSASKPFSPVHIFQKDPPARNDYVKADEWEGCMNLTGYTLQVNRNISLLANSLEYLDHNQILELSASQIKLALAVEQNPVFIRRVPHRLIVANTPKN